MVCWSPFVTWGTNPGQGVPLSATVPNPEDYADPSDQAAARKALEAALGLPVYDVLDLLSGFYADLSKRR